MVDIHLRAFPGFFLTLLGRRFLRRLYGGFVSSQDARAIVAEVDARVVGFAVGTCSPEQHFRARLHSEGLWFALAAVPALFRAPVRVSRKLWSALRYRGERPIGLAESWLLSSIGIDPDARSAGAGATLVNAFCSRARDSGARHVYLLTDEEGNAGVHRFYERTGFHVHSSLTRGDGRIMRLYVQHVGVPEAHDVR
jgi:GNAT superfamily N-acetyltransferase